MRVLLCKLCEFVCKLENGRHNLVGVFDDVRAQNFPIDHPPFFLAVQLEFEDEDFGEEIKVNVRLLDPEGKEMLRSDLTGTAPPGPKGEIVRMFFFAPVQPIRLQAPGQYRLMVSSHGDIIHIEALPVYKVQ